MQRKRMNTDNIFLVVFLGGKTMDTWDALPDAQRQKKMKEGIAAWNAWCEHYKDAIVEVGGPLGNTKKISSSGITDIADELCAYMFVRADSHEEAAKMFEQHPHFAVFPGEYVEVRPLLPRQ